MSTPPDETPSTTDPLSPQVNAKPQESHDRPLTNALAWAEKMAAVKNQVEIASRWAADNLGTSALKVQRVDIISHKDCLDGIAAAWVVKKFHDAVNASGLSAIRYNAHIHYTDYHLPLPEIPESSSIYMVDFCPNDVEELKPLLANCHGLTIIDHHPKTEGVIQSLKGWAETHDNDALYRLSSVFSREASGALLAWWHLMGTKEAPVIVQAVSDRDLWQFKLPDTEPLCEALMAYGMTVDDFDACVNEIPYAELLHRGAVLMQAKASLIDWMIDNTRCELEAHMRATHDIATVKLLAVNGSKPLASKACEELEKRYPGYDAYVCYWDIEGGTHRRYSIRRSDGDVPRRIAQYYAGDGHPSAAGFVTTQYAALRVLPLTV